MFTPKITSLKVQFRWKYHLNLDDKIAENINFVFYFFCTNIEGYITTEYDLYLDIHILCLDFLNCRLIL